MWSALVKLVELLDKKWSESRQPRRRLAKAIAVLYSSLSACHEAYLAHRADPELGHFRRWAAALDSLVVTLASVEVTLNVFAPEVRDELVRYIDSEQRASGAYNPDRLLELSLGEIRYAVGDQVSPWQTETIQQGDMDDDEDFALAVKMLGDFIRANFKLEEIYGEIG
jgi:hypothetical protein